jgi:hypothetical protein
MIRSARSRARRGLAFLLATPAVLFVSGAAHARAEGAPHRPAVSTLSDRFGSGAAAKSHGDQGAPSRARPGAVALPFCEPPDPCPPEVDYTEPEFCADDDAATPVGPGAPTGSGCG